MPGWVVFVSCWGPVGGILRCGAGYFGFDTVKYRIVLWQYFEFTVRNWLYVLLNRNYSAC